MAYCRDTPPTSPQEHSLFDSEENFLIASLFSTSPPLSLCTQDITGLCSEKNYSFEKFPGYEPNISNPWNKKNRSKEENLFDLEQCQTFLKEKTKEEESEIDYPYLEKETIKEIMNFQNHGSTLERTIKETIGLGFICDKVKKEVCLFLLDLIHHQRKIIHSLQMSIKREWISIHENDLKKDEDIIPLSNKIRNLIKIEMHINKNRLITVKRENWLYEKEKSSIQENIKKLIETEEHTLSKKNKMGNILKNLSDELILIYAYSKDAESRKKFHQELKKSFVKTKNMCINTKQTLLTFYTKILFIYEERTSLLSNAEEDNPREWAIKKDNFLESCIKSSSSSKNKKITK